MKMVVRFGNDPCDVYVGRPSKWANPFRIGPDGSREEVLEQYMGWLTSRPNFFIEIRRDLKGRVLGCWCKPYFDCHGDILARIANDWQLCLPLTLE